MGLRKRRYVYRPALERCRCLDRRATRPRVFARPAVGRSSRSAAAITTLGRSALVMSPSGRPHLFADWIAPDDGASRRGDHGEGPAAGDGWGSARPRSVASCPPADGARACARTAQPSRAELAGRTRICNSNGGFFSTYFNGADCVGVDVSPFAGKYRRWDLYLHGCYPTGL